MASQSVRTAGGGVLSSGFSAADIQHQAVPGGGNGNGPHGSAGAQVSQVGPQPQPSSGVGSLGANGPQQQQQPPLAPGELEDFKLSIKVLCAVGRLYAYHVGYCEVEQVNSWNAAKGSGRWEFFLGDGIPLPGGTAPAAATTADPAADAASSAAAAGAAALRPPMRQLIDVEEFAGKTQVVISHEVRKLHGEQLEVESLGEGQAYRLLGIPGLSPHVKPDAADLLDTKIPQLPGASATSLYLEAIKAHVPRCVSASIRDGHREFASEVRYCSCAFFGFPNLIDGARDQEDAVQHIQKAFENVDKAMSIYEGEFMQFRCDEKGFLAVCCFGLMGKTHKDDAMRAVHSALSVCNRMEKQGLQACCGVTTGILLCAFVGASDRCEYTVFGDAINTSGEEKDRVCFVLMFPFFYPLSTRSLFKPACFLI
jgi:hypothetical protein